MKQYVYCVPTNRTLQANHQSFCEEAEYAVHQYNCDMSFLLTDDMIASGNREVLRKTAAEHRDVKYYYIDKDRMSALLSAVAEYFPKEEQAKMACLLPKNEINYGNTINREFILSILLGCPYMIRRDSDVHIQSFEGKPLYPIDLELQYLGGQHNGKTNYIIGSGYQGKWGIDMDDIIEHNDYTLFKDFMSCMNIPRDFLDTIVEDEFIKTKEYVGDQVDFQSAAYPQCGNISFFQLFTALPCSPAADIIATDYFLHEAGYDLGFNIGFHTRTVLHKHTKDRTETKEKILNYWERVAMWIDTELVYKSFIKSMKPYEGELEQSWQRKSLNQYVLGCFKAADIKNQQLDSIRKEKYREFADTLAKAHKPIYGEIAEYLMEHEAEVHKKCTESKFQHENLIEVWSKLVEVLEEVKDKDSIKNILEGAVL